MASTFARSVRIRAFNLERSRCGFVSPLASVGTTLSVRRGVGLDRRQLKTRP